MGGGEWMDIVHVYLYLRRRVDYNERRTCVPSRELLKMVQAEFAFSIGTFVLYI
jgi:hypothetical protein